MRKKIFTILLALAASVGMMNAKVTWNSSNISDLRVMGTYASYSKEGVTLSANAEMVEARWNDYGDESMDGISFNANETGGYTFSNTLGKNFTKIEMLVNRPGGWAYANLGSDWSFPWISDWDSPVTVTWTGNAATVDLLKDESGFNAEPVKSIVFYFVGDSEAPDPTYTVALKAGTVNADKVKLSATSAVEGATITVTPNEEYEITAFKATYNTTEELSTSFNAETGAYSFTMPAYDVTIEATIALKPVYTVALEEGTVNADKVTLSATSAVEGATVTVTPNEEYEITDFSAYYVVVDGQLGSINEIDATLNTETGAYSFTMPAYDVTIEATIALKPVPEGDIFAGFTARAGSGGFDNEGHANLVDNKFTDGNWTKWCTNNDHKSVPTGELESCWWIDFEASAALNPTGYILTTGNDTGSEHGRNPKNWVLKAKLNADDAWTTIATVDNDATMKNQSFKDYKFFVDQSGSYKYFRFEVFANQGANVMQLCELRLIGTEPSLVTTHTLQLHVNDAAMGSVAVTNLLGSDIIDNGDGTYTVPEGAEVTILATPKEGYEFIGWKASNTLCDFTECEFVDLNTVDNPLTFDMYREVAFMAEFAAVAPQPAGNVVIWNMSMDAVNREVDQNETKEVFGGITLTVGAWRGFMMHENSNALLFSFNTKAQEGFTFANTLGVNFKKIVLSGAANTFDGKESTGWVINEDKSTITWEGDAASVSIWETLDIVGPVKVKEVEFTLEGGEPAPTVWTALAVGDVIKVGDKIEVPNEGDGSWGINGNVLRNAWGPYTLIRADIYQASDFDDPEVTETEDGAFYVFKAENSDFYPLSYLGKSGGLVVTMTSDGLVVTAAENKEFTVAVHDKGDTPTAVENVQTNPAQATKFFRDGMLLIERNGKIYNVQGVEVR